jgi:hypothetical protein
MNVRTKLIGTIVVGAALLVPVAQAQRPDDRAGPRGPGAIAQNTFVQGIDDFPGSSKLAPQSNGVAVRGEVKDGVGTSPSGVIVGDDKRDIGAEPVSGVLVGDDKRNLRPDNWAYAAWPVVDPAVYAPQSNQFAYRRALPQDLGREPIQVVSTSARFNWDDALIGGLGGAGAALLLTGCAFLLMSKRTRARTA